MKLEFRGGFLEVMNKKDEQVVSQKFNSHK